MYKRGWRGINIDLNPLSIEKIPPSKRYKFEYWLSKEKKIVFY